MKYIIGIQGVLIFFLLCWNLHNHYVVKEIKFKIEKEPIERILYHVYPKKTYTSTFGIIPKKIWEEKDDTETIHKN